MRVGSLSATGAKNLALHGVPFREVTLVHGPNGIGKSNLLLVLDVLLRRKASVPEMQDQIKFGVEGITEVPDFFRRGTTEADAELIFECYTASFTKLKAAFPYKPRHPKDRVPHQVRLSFHLSEYSGGVRSMLGRISIGSRTIYDVAAKSPLSATQMKALEDWIDTDVAGATVYIPANRIYRREPVPLDLRSTRPPVERLENAILRLLTSKDGDSEVIDKIRGTMREFFGIEDIRSEIRMVEHPAPAGAPEYLVGIRLKERSGEWFDLERMGTGIQQILAIVTMLHLSRSKIALIEEFDTSLSPAKRSQLLEQLKQLVGEGKPLRQVIVTSHASFQPKQDRVLSLGAERGAEGGTGFRVWSRADWDRFEAEDDGVDSVRDE